jgi:hypothetical protein
MMMKMMVVTLAVLMKVAAVKKTSSPAKSIGAGDTIVAHSQALLGALSDIPSMGSSHGNEDVFECLLLFCWSSAVADDSACCWLVLTKFSCNPLPTDVLAHCACWLSRWQIALASKPCTSEYAKRQRISASSAAAFKSPAGREFCSTRPANSSSSVCSSTASHVLYCLGTTARTWQYLSTVASLLAQVTIAHLYGGIRGIAAEEEAGS